MKLETWQINKIASKAAAARLTGWGNQVYEVVPKPDSEIVVVTSKKFQTVNIPVQSFLHDFVEIRRIKGRKLLEGNKVGHLDGLVFACEGEDAEDAYLIDLNEAKAPRCRCNDYENRAHWFPGLFMCEHGYAVLFGLGYASLNDYLKNKKTLPQLIEVNEEESIAA